MGTIMKLQKLFIVGAIFSGFIFAANTFAEDVITNTESNLEKVTCWEISTLPEDAAAYALVLLYGYKAGKSNQPIQVASKISEAIISAGETCDGNPDLLVINAFKKL